MLRTPTDSGASTKGCGATRNNTTPQHRELHRDAALHGVVREQRLLIWHGTGANGKGMLRDAVLHAMGEYAVEVDSAILLQSRYGQQANAPERVKLKGARMAFCSEIPEGARIDEATMKKLAGGDPVTAKLLYRTPITFLPSHTPWSC